MPKVTEEYRRARRDEIIAVAIQCFQSRGFARTSISDLVAASGLSAGAIYGNFPGGKDEIFVAAATKILHTRRSELEARRTERTLSPGEVMATLIEGISSEQISHVLPQLWGEAAVDPDIRVLVQGVFLQLRRTVVDAIAAWARRSPRRSTAIRRRGPSAPRPSSSPPHRGSSCSRRCSPTSTPRRTSQLCPTSSPVDDAGASRGERA